MRANKNLNQIDNIAVKTGIYEFIQKLPSTYDTIIGEQGLQVSGGQAQRIALTREFLKKPSLLILDEPTSALDPYSEKLINDCIKNISSEITLLVISHKPSSLHYCDKVFIMTTGNLRPLTMGTNFKLDNNIYS